MVRHLFPIALAASTLVATASAQDQRPRTTVRGGAYGSVATAIGMNDDRLVLGLTTSSGGMRDTLGLLISSVTPGSPAEKAGLEEGNRITAVNGVSLRLIPADASDPEMAGVLGRRFQRELEKMKAGEAVTLRVLANGQSKDVKVTPVRANELSTARGAGRTRADERTTIGATLGGFESPRDTIGVFVVAVAEDGPLAKAGVFEGSRIASINNVDLRVPAADVGDEFMTSSRVRRLTREIEKLEPGANAELRVYANGQYRNVTVKTVKRSELKQDGGFSIFHSGGGTGVFVPPMFDMQGFRFDMNHDMSDEIRTRIEEALRGRDIQLRSLRERLEDGQMNLFDLQNRLRDDLGRGDLEEMLRALPGRSRTSGDSADDTATRPATRPPQPATAAPLFRSALMNGSLDMARGQFASAFAGAPAFASTLGFDVQGVQTAQGGQGAQPRQGRSGTTTYRRSGDAGTQGAVFMVEGIRLSPINAQLASYLGSGSERGLLVLEIDDSWSGLLAGDVLMSINGRAVVRNRTIDVFIDSAKELPVEILRSGETIKATLKRRD
jgi:serine protease Do